MDIIFAPLVAFSVYWSLFCLLLIVCAHVFFQRGVSDGFADRMRIARTRLSAGVITIGGLAVVLFAAVGGWIFYNTNVLNTFSTVDAGEQLQADYEKSFKQYELAVRPEVVDVDSQVDLYPEERRLESLGTAVLENVADTANRGSAYQHSSKGRCEHTDTAGGNLARAYRPIRCAPV